MGNLQELVTARTMTVGKRREARSRTACLQGADFHIGNDESSEEAFNNPVFLQGWVIPPLPASEGSERDGSVCSQKSICSSDVSQQTKEGPSLGVLAGRAHVDTSEWLTVLGPRLLRWLVR